MRRCGPSSPRGRRPCDNPRWPSQGASAVCRPAAGQHPKSSGVRNVDRHPRRARARAGFHPRPQQCRWPDDPAAGCGPHPQVPRYRRVLPRRRTRWCAGRLPCRPGLGRRARQQQLPLVPRALRAVLLYRPDRGRQPPSRRRRGPRVLRRRPELCRTALSAADLRGVPGARRRSGSPVPRQLRVPRDRPARDARERHPRLDDGQGHVQLRVGPRDLRRGAPRPALAAAPARGPGRVVRRMSAAMDFEQAGELKIGQVGIANLRVRTLDIARLADEMRSRVARAPKLFARAAVIVDFGGLAATPDAATARALVEALREAGVLPVALAWGSGDNEKLAVEIGLPVLARFRAQYESVAGGAETAPAAEPAPPPAPAQRASAPAAAARQDPAGPGLVQTAPVRSGQQLYAENRDLTVLSQVGAGAEVIADGSIHIYG